MLIAFHKPYGVLSQFTKEMPYHRTLAEFGFPKNVYPIGRLDWDTEGLLLLSNEKKWNHLLLNPKHAHERTYHAQVEGTPSDNHIKQLEKGVWIRNRKTRPCKARLLSDPTHPARNPPIRFRATIPTCWLELKLIEGKNRQVRKMTAACGLPTLRLIRIAVGKFDLDQLAPGKWRVLTEKEIKTVLKN